MIRSTRLLALLRGLLLLPLLLAALGCRGVPPALTHDHATFAASYDEVLTRIDGHDTDYAGYLDMAGTLVTPVLVERLADLADDTLSGIVDAILRRGLL